MVGGLAAGTHRSERIRAEWPSFLRTRTRTLAPPPAECSTSPPQHHPTDQRTPGLRLRESAPLGAGRHRQPQQADRAPPGRRGGCSAPDPDAQRKLLPPPRPGGHVRRGGRRAPGESGPGSYTSGVSHGAPHGHGKRHPGATPHESRLQIIRPLRAFPSSWRTPGRGGVGRATTADNAPIPAIHGSELSA